MDFAARIVSFRFLAILLLALGGCASGGIREGEVSETKEDRDRRMAWWREAKFGMFIHWGLYAVPAGTWKGKKIDGIGEWIMQRARIPVEEYGALAGSFNPVKYDADAWVRLAKEAGMKYVVITSKHHDGFAMFHSRASGYNIVDATPFTRDPLMELAEACRRHGLKLGFYYSQAQDWHHPGGAAAGGHWDPAQDGDMTAYIRKIAEPQVREILTGYGPLAILWWDTPVNMNRERAEILAPLLALQPGIITNNRLGGGFGGDTDTPEQYIPATGMPGRDWETCMTMNDTWGFKSYDENWKPPEALIRNLVDIVSKGGNYLLNVGPTAQGEIPGPSIDRLKEMGRWLGENGEAIYGTSPSVFRKLKWGRCTRKGSRLFLHVFDWPRGGLAVPGLRNEVRKAYLHSDSEKRPLKVSRARDAILVDVPEKAPDSAVSVVVLEIDGEPDVDNAIRPVASGEIALSAADATIHGKSARYEYGYGKDNIGYWVDRKDWVEWEFAGARAGVYRVETAYACDPESAGAECVIALDGQELVLKVGATKNWTDFVTVELGRVKLAGPGQLVLSVKVRSMPGYAAVNLKSVRLIPVD